MFELFICGEDGISSEVKSFGKLSANSAEETFSESSSKDYDIDMIWYDLQFCKTTICYAKCMVIWFGYPIKWWYSA